ncbi:MAG: secretin N-terminal domain-containing protein [Opitutaceae bacterium]|nr:secretin N-terminal domain-containing protein [Opitutaceae bacterium]
MLAFAMPSYPIDSGPSLPRGWRMILALAGALIAGDVLFSQGQSATTAPSLAAALGGNPADEPADVSFKFRDESIDQVLSMLENLTGRSVMHPQQLPPNTYTFTTQRPLTRSEAIRAIETMLNMNGIAVVPLGDNFLKVTPVQLARTEAPLMIDGSTLGLPPSGRIAAKLFQLNFLRASEFVPMITGLLNPNLASPPAVFDRANAMLVTDSVSNLQRIEALLQKVDQPATAALAPRFYSLKYAKASDTVTKIRTIFQSQPLQAQLGAATTYSADDRTNQIIVVSDPRQFAFFDELIARLDVKADPNTRNEVLPLKHATAADVAQLLAQIIAGQNNAARSSGQDTTAQLRAGQPPATNAPGSTPAGQAALAALGAESTNQFSSVVTVLADARSNSIVVSGTVDDLRLIRGIIDKIDVLLAQVRIEVIIAEVTLTDADKTGLSALNLTVGTDPARGTRITNFTGSVAGWDVTSGVVNPLAFQAALNSAGTRSNVKILSAPTITTTHNKQAQVVVGQQQPVVTGVISTPSATTTTTGLTTSSQVTYKNIAIDLKVTPLIGDDGSVQLTIDQTVDDVLGNVTIDNNSQPIIGHRQATSFINVQDGQMIVLGGLQRTKNTADRNKIGLLAEIPILSHLLGARENTLERTELLLFIRPHVIRPGETTGDTTKSIEALSNQDQVRQFLTDPSKTAKDSLIDKLK